MLRAELTGGWTCDRDRRGCRSASERAAAGCVCGDDSDPDLRRGTGSVRIDCGDHLESGLITSSSLIINHPNSTGFVYLRPT